MYVTMRKYNGATSKDEVIKRVKEGLLPQLRDSPGFVAYYGIEFEDGDLGAVSIFATKEDADRSTEKALKWVRENLSDLLPNEPKVLHGDVLLNTEAKVISKTA